MTSKIKEFLHYIRDIKESRRVLLKLAINDFKVKYAGSYLGIIWAFIQPIVTIFVFWFVFQVGFKNPPVVGDFPFVLWLICGLIPWFFFSDALSNATNCLLEYNYLVKKVVFRVSILPIMKIVSSLFVHLFFVLFIFLMFLIYGYEVDIYYIQVFYYILSSIMFLLGLSWLTSSVVIFFKDLKELINIVLQLGFWLTPIFWNYEILPGRFQNIIKLNPMFYIVGGFRDTFINKVWFWERLNHTLYFWVLTVVLFIGGSLIFRRLRPHFSDVL